jgi:hypothetical protein
MKARNIIPFVAGSLLLWIVAVIVWFSDYAWRSLHWVNLHSSSQGLRLVAWLRTLHP